MRWRVISFSHTQASFNHEILHLICKKELSIQQEKAEVSKTNPELHLDTLSLKFPKNSSQLNEEKPYFWALLTSQHFIFGAKLERDFWNYGQVMDFSAKASWQWLAGTVVCAETSHFQLMWHSACPGQLDSRKNTLRDLSYFRILFLNPFFPNLPLRKSNVFLRGFQTDLGNAHLEAEKEEHMRCHFFY